VSNHLTKLFDAVFSMPKEKQQELFKRLVSSNGAEARKILQEQFPTLYKSPIAKKRA
jgi:hypothetical protein